MPAPALCRNITPQNFTRKKENIKALLQFSVELFQFRSNCSGLLCYQCFHNIFILCWQSLKIWLFDLISCPWSFSYNPMKTSSGKFCESTGMYFGLYEISMMELFTKIANGLKPWTIFAKVFIIDTWLNPKYASVHTRKQNRFHKVYWPENSEELDNFLLWPLHKKCSFPTKLSHLLKKPLMENFIFCAVIQRFTVNTKSTYTGNRVHENIFFLDVSIAAEILWKPAILT